VSDENRVSLDGVRVLYVEDDDDTRAMMVILLGKAGASLRAVASAVDAIAALEREQFDVLVSDARMPGKDGWALIEEVRTRSKARGGMIPAIAVTGSAFDADIARSLRAGFNAHLSKPIDISELGQLITSLVGRGPVSNGATV
jgi:CheY-like chemotaxis protein